MSHWQACRFVRHAAFVIPAALTFGNALGQSVAVTNVTVIDVTTGQRQRRYRFRNVAQIAAVVVRGRLVSKPAIDRIVASHHRAGGAP
jgi:hypothetical protein